MINICDHGIRCKISTAIFNPSSDRSPLETSRMVR